MQQSRNRALQELDLLKQPAIWTRTPRCGPQPRNSRAAGVFERGVRGELVGWEPQWRGEKASGAFRLQSSQFTGFWASSTSEFCARLKHAVAPCAATRKNQSPRHTGVRPCLRARRRRYRHPQQQQQMHMDTSAMARTPIIAITMMSP